MTYKFRIRSVLLGLLVSSAFALEQAGSQWKNSPEGYFFSAGGSYLGIDIRDITPDRMGALKLKEERGVEVVDIDQDAPASKAGLKEHDVVLEYNGTRIESAEQLRRLIRETPPGRTATLAISRDGNPIAINVQVGDRSKLTQNWQKATRDHRIIIAPHEMELPEIDFQNFDILPFSNTPSLGLHIERLNQQLGEFFGVKGGGGLLVRSVDKGGAAEQAGLKAGDVLLRIDNEKITDSADLRRVLRVHQKDGKITLGIVREKREQNIILDIPQRKLQDSSGLRTNLPEMDALNDQLAGLTNDQSLFAEENFEPEIDKGMWQDQSQVEDLHKMYDSGKQEIDNMTPEIDKAIRNFKLEMEQMPKTHDLE